MGAEGPFTTLVVVTENDEKYAGMKKTAHELLSGFSLDSVMYQVLPHEGKRGELQDPSAATVAMSKLERAYEMSTSQDKPFLESGDIVLMSHDVVTEVAGQERHRILRRINFEESDPAKFWAQADEVLAQARQELKDICMFQHKVAWKVGLAVMGTSGTVRAVEYLVRANFHAMAEAEVEAYFALSPELLAMRGERVPKKEEMMMGVQALKIGPGIDFVGRMSGEHVEQIAVEKDGVPIDGILAADLYRMIVGAEFPPHVLFELLLGIDEPVHGAQVA